MFPARLVQACHISAFDRCAVRLRSVRLDEALVADRLGNEVRDLKDRLVDSCSDVNPIKRIAQPEQMDKGVG